MDNLNKVYCNKSEAIHLLQEIDVKSVKNYMHELLSQHHLKKSEFTSKCLICTSSLLKNWQNLVHHLRSPSHVDNIKRNCKQFTAICILCRYILIADDTDFIFEHFTQHKAATGQSDKKVVHKTFENDSASHNLSITTTSSVFKDNENIHTNPKKKYQQQTEKECIDFEKTIVGNIEEVAAERPESVLKNNYIKPDVEHFGSSNSVKNNLTDRHVISSVSYNGNKMLSTRRSSNVKTSPILKSSTNAFNNYDKNNVHEVREELLKEHVNHHNCQKKNTEARNIDNDNRIKRRSRLAINFNKTSNNTRVVTTISNESLYSSSIGGVIPPLESYRDIDSNKSVEVTASQNCITECSIEGFYPEKAFFSNKTLQLTSLGVSEDEFTITQALSAENIANYCTKTYYSSYYRLRKLYFSCLICKALRLEEKNFYRHLSGFKHNNIVGDCYSTVFIKICDICQVLLLGDMDLTKKHFQCDAHQQNIKCKMGLIKQQYAVMSGVQKLGFSGELTHTCTSFSSKEALNRWVESLLKDAREVASMAVSLCTVLERDIKETLKDKYINFHVKIIGSRLYELANRQSDVDIHLDIGNVSVGFLEEYFYRAGFFQVQRCILDAKVPIIRLKHLESSLICDINTTNPAGPYCSELIKLYISLDERVRWLAIAITEWSAENDIRGARKFKSYALMGLVLFFLMSPNIRLIPSVHELKSLYEGSRVYIKGWDYSFCRDVEKIKKMHNPLLCKLNKYELLAEFFKYYSMHDAKRSVIFPHNGKIYRKVAFANPSKDIYPGVHSNQEDNEPLSIGGRFILIDFFCLRENINKSVDENLSDHFQSICRKTLVCGWQK